MYTSSTIDFTNERDTYLTYVKQPLLDYRGQGRAKTKKENKICLISILNEMKNIEFRFQ